MDASNRSYFAQILTDMILPIMVIILFALSVLWLINGINQLSLYNSLQVYDMVTPPGEKLGHINHPEQTNATILFYPVMQDVKVAIQAILTWLIGVVATKIFNPIIDHWLERLKSIIKRETAK